MITTIIVFVAGVAIGWRATPAVSAYNAARAAGAGVTKSHWIALAAAFGIGVSAQ